MSPHGPQLTGRVIVIPGKGSTRQNPSPPCVLVIGPPSQLSIRLAGKLTSMEMSKFSNTI